MANDNSNNPSGAYPPPYYSPYPPPYYAYAPYFYSGPPPAPTNKNEPPPMMGYPPPWPHAMHGYPPPPPPPEAAPQQPGQGHYQHASAMDWSEKAQGIVENAMGEQASVLKTIISTIGADDKEFWKGAMIGAAATLLLTNDNIRSMLLQTLSGAGDLLKTGSGKVKDTVLNSAGTLKETATTSSDIVRDTFHAGKKGFQESRERHRQPPVSTDSHDEVGDNAQ